MVYVPEVTYMAICVWGFSGEPTVAEVPRILSLARVSLMGHLLKLLQSAAVGFQEGVF